MHQLTQLLPSKPVAPFLIPIIDEIELYLVAGKAGRQRNAIDRWPISRRKPAAMCFSRTTKQRGPERRRIR